MQENPERNHQIEQLNSQLQGVTKDVDELRTVVQFLATQLWALQDDSPEKLEQLQQDSIKSTAQSNKFQLKLLRYVLILSLGIFSIFYGAIAGTEISRTTEQGQVTIKGAEVLSGLSAFAGGMAISVLGFADRIAQRRSRRGRR